MSKLDFSKPEELQTRDGRQVRIYATDGMGIYPVHGAIKNDGGWIAERWDDEGSNYHSRGASDLVRKPARVKGWVNAYYRCLGSTIFETKEAAQAVGGKCLGQIYIDAEVQQ